MFVWVIRWFPSSSAAVGRTGRRRSSVWASTWCFSCWELTHLKLQPSWWCSYRWFHIHSNWWQCWLAQVLETWPLSQHWLSMWPWRSHYFPWFPNRYWQWLSCALASPAERLISLWSAAARHSHRLLAMRPARHFVIRSCPQEKSRVCVCHGDGDSSVCRTVSPTPFLSNSLPPSSPASQFSLLPWWEKSFLLQRLTRAKSTPLTGSVRRHLHRLCCLRQYHFSWYDLHDPAPWRKTFAC